MKDYMIKTISLTLIITFILSSILVADGKTISKKKKTTPKKKAPVTAIKPKLIPPKKTPSPVKPVVKAPAAPAVPVPMDTQQVFQKVSPAIVYIEVLFPDGIAQGSGFIVSSTGDVLTNYHVVKNATAITVTTNSKQKFYLQKAYQFDEKKDIALLKLKDASQLPTVPIGNSDILKNGQQVIAIGNPEGLENSISDGIVSQAKREIEGQSLIQITTPISPGSSGGVLVNIYGEAVGITVGAILEGQNLNFAVPINQAKLLLDNKSSVNPAASSVTNIGAALTAPQNIQAIPLSDAKIRVQWDAVPGAESYDVYERVATRMGPFLKIGNTAKTEYDATGLIWQETYDYKVIPIRNGKEGPVSSIATNKPLPPFKNISSFSYPGKINETFEVEGTDQDGRQIKLEICLNRISRSPGPSEDLTYVSATFLIKVVGSSNLESYADQYDWVVAYGPDEVVKAPYRFENSYTVVFTIDSTRKARAVFLYGSGQDVWFSLD
ncbi:MAG: trypsin-like peptidase domain-containing protein [Acidobacteriota bacterium]